MKKQIIYSHRIFNFITIYLDFDMRTSQGFKRHP